MRTQPELPEAQYNLGLAYASLADPNEAEKHLRLDPQLVSESLKAGDPEVRRALTLIARARVPHA